MTSELRIGSLFSGIGGLELGLEWSGLGHTVWQVESNPFCRQVLAKHWPEVPRYEDIREVGAAQLEPVDLVCGGFPCQDISSAGKGAGLAGERSGLWFEFARVLTEIRPAWVVVENVASGAVRWVDQIVAWMEEQGWAALPVPLSARDVGAPHLRRRVFIVGYAARDSESALPEHGEVAGVQNVAGSAANSERVDIRQQSRGCGGPDRSGERVVGVAGAEGEVADAGCLCGIKRKPQPDLSRGQKSSRGENAGDDQRCDWGESMPKPALCRVDDGPAAWVDRNDRIRALGNAVVPQCAEVIGYIIRELAQDQTHEGD